MSQLQSMRRVTAMVLFAEGGVEEDDGNGAFIDLRTIDASGPLTFYAAAKEFSEDGLVVKLKHSATNPLDDEGAGLEDLDGAAFEFDADGFGKVTIDPRFETIGRYVCVNASGEQDLFVTCVLEYAPRRVTTPVAEEPLQELPPEPVEEAPPQLAQHFEFFNGGDGTHYETGDLPVTGTSLDLESVGYVEGTVDESGKYHLGFTVFVVPTTDGTGQIDYVIEESDDDGDDDPYTENATTAGSCPLGAGESDSFLDQRTFKRFVRLKLTEAGTGEFNILAGLWGSVVD